MGREVDTKFHIHSPITELRQRLGCVTDNPTVDIEHQSEALGNRQEAVGQLDRVAVLPHSEQHFKQLSLPVSDVDDGLIVKYEVIVADCILQPLRETDVRHHLLSVPVSPREQAKAVPPTRFRFVARHVGLGYELVRREAVGVDDCYADAAADVEDLSLLDEMHVLQNLDQRLGDWDNTLAVDPAGEDGKFVASEAT